MPVDILTALDDARKQCDAGDAVGCGDTIAAIIDAFRKQTQLTWYRDDFYGSCWDYVADPEVARLIRLLLKKKTVTRSERENFVALFKLVGANVTWGQVIPPEKVEK